MENLGNPQPIDEEPVQDDSVRSGDTTEAGEDHEDVYYDLLEKLEESGKGLGKRWAETLTPQIDSGEITFEDAVEKVKDVMEQREIAKLKHNTLSNPEHTIKDIEKLRNLIESLKRSMRAENFLGNGAVADVYSSDSIELSDLNFDDAKACIKIIINDERYREGNTVHAEAEILKDLTDFEAGGVRSPHYIDHLSGGDLVAIIMEELDAANLGRVMDESITNNRDVLPEKFNLDTYFDDLKIYVEAMHAKGYYHLDLAARNLMVDLETGKPRVIDFGKSKYIPLKGDLKDEAEKDMAGLEGAKQKIKKFIEENGSLHNH